MPEFLAALTGFQFSLAAHRLGSRTEFFLVHDFPWPAILGGWAETAIMLLQPLDDVGGLTGIENALWIGYAGRTRRTWLVLARPSAASLNSLAQTLAQANPLYRECRSIINYLEPVTVAPDARVSPPVETEANNDSVKNNAAFIPHDVFEQRQH